MPTTAPPPVAPDPDTLDAIELDLSLGPPLPRYTGSLVRLAVQLARTLLAERRKTAELEAENAHLRGVLRTLAPSSAWSRSKKEKDHA